MQLVRHCGDRSGAGGGKGDEIVLERACFNRSAGENKRMEQIIETSEA